MSSDFRFKKNERGFNPVTGKILHHLLVGGSRVFFNVRVTGRENMPKDGACFIYGNHSNYCDPFFLNTLLSDEPTAGVMTREQFHNFVSAVAMDSVGIVPTLKYVPEPHVIRSVMKMVDQKRRIVIFPEGGRRWDGRPKGLIESTMKLFWKMKVPVHPVQLHGSFLSWPRWANYPRPNSTEVRWMKPLHTSNFADFESFAEAVREAIRFEEYNPPTDTLPKFAYKPAAGIERFLYRCPVTGVLGAVYSPDGHEVRSRTAPEFRFALDKHSRLIDDSHAEHSLLDVFDGVNTLPMVKDKNTGVLLEAHDRKLYTLDSKLNLITLPHGHMLLTEEHVNWSVDGESHQVPVSDIKYMSIEQNHKLSLYPASGGTIQINLDGGSALAWQIYIRRLQKGETPI